MRSFKSIFFAVFLLLFLSAYAYFEYHLKQEQKSQIQSGPRNIYIITASGLRPDHLTSYMYDHDQTPSIDFLAYDGIRFLNAYSTSSDSLPAHLSLFTGLYPFSRDVARTLDYEDGLAPEVHSPPLTMPKWFADKGYKTAAFLSDPELRHPALFQNMFQEIAFGDRVLPPWKAAYTPKDVSTLAREWIFRNSRHPQFLFVNYSEPTFPFQPPQPYAQQYAKHPYDGEIASLDEKLGFLIHAIKEADLFKNSIIVFASPYGESLDQEIRTGSLKPAIIKIPLFIAAPGLLPVHQEYNHPASLIDVFPSILTLLDQSFNNKMDGIPLFKKGTSEEIVREFLFAETRVPLLFSQPPGYFITNGSSYYETAQSEGDIHLRSMLEGKVGKLGSPDSATSRLLEQAIVLAKNGNPAAALALLESSENKLRAVICPSFVALKAELAAEGGDYTRARNFYEMAYRQSQLPELLASLSLIELKSGNPKSAMQRQQEYRKSLKNVSYLDNSTIGIAAYQLGENQLAQHELTEALQKNPRLSDVYFYRAMVFEKENQKQEAEADLKKAFQLDPENHLIAQELAKLLENQKRAADAIPYFRKLLDRNQKDYEAMLDLARLQQESGDDQAARKLCEQVLLYADDPALRSKAKEIIAR